MIPGWGRCIKAFLLKGKIYSFLLFSLSRSHSAKQCENMLSIFSHSRSLLELTYIEFILPRNCSVTSVTSSINYAIVPSFCRSAAYLNGYILCYFFSGPFEQNSMKDLTGGTHAAAFFTRNGYIAKLLFCFVRLPKICRGNF